MFCAMREFVAPRWRDGDARLRPNAPYGVPPSAPLGPVAFGRRADGPDVFGVESAGLSGKKMALEPP